MLLLTGVNAVAVNQEGCSGGSCEKRADEELQQLARQEASHACSLDVGPAAIPGVEAGFFQAAGITGTVSGWCHFIVQPLLWRPEEAWLTTFHYAGWLPV